MKKFLLAFALFIGVASFYNTAQAQNINISINVGRQPAWGPVGYDYVGYYYFPDIDCYYDVNMEMFYYQDRGRWISARYLPYAYSRYDLYGMYKVVLNVREPWRYHHTHYRDYGRYRGYRNQVIIRDSRDYRYRDSRNNRVAWYSHSNKGSNHRNDSYRRNDNRYNDNRYNDNRSNHKYYDRDNNRGNSRPNSSIGNRNDNNKRPSYTNNRDGRSTERKDSYNSRPSSTRENNSSRESRVTRSSSSRSDFRVAANTERNSRNR